MTTALDAMRSESRRYLTVTYPERMAQALEALPEGDLWWRPHPGALAFGTILVHLEGNVRQWILSGVGGEADHRERSREFRAGPQDTAAGPELLERLGATCSRAGEILEGLSDERLAEEVVIQGFPTTVLSAILHVVEHFSWHTGQAVWIAKARSGPGHGVAFYDDAALEDARNE